MSLDGQFRQLIISDPQKKAPPAVAPKPKVQNSSPKPFRPGGSSYRQFQRTEDFPPPPPQTAYVEEQNFPPPPPDTGRGYGYQEVHDEFPPPPEASTGYRGRDVTSPIHVATDYNQQSTYNSQSGSYGGNQYSPSSGGYQSKPRTEVVYRTESPVISPYQVDERQRNYSENSSTVYQPKSNYANIESIQSAYSDSSPVPQEQPIYAKPNIRGSSSDMYNRPSSNSPSYMTGSPDQYQYQSEPSPPVHGGSPNQFYGRQNSGERSPIIYTQQNSGGERTRHLSGGSGGFSPRFDEGTRPVPGPQVPAVSMQGTSKNKEAEVDALTSLLMENMSSSADPEFMGICCRCNRKVIGETNGCTAQDQVYHVSCFTCMECGTMLTGKQFYSMDTKPYCEACYVNTLERCSVCSKPVTDRLLRATGKPYHPDCFVCVVCGKSLDGIPFTVDATSQIHCIEDFHKKFAPRCCVCHQPIMPKKGQEETVRVVAMDKSFHVECYRCEDCGLQLSSDAEGRGCYPLDEHILCKNCNARRIQAMTTKMTTEL